VPQGDLVVCRAHEPGRAAQGAQLQMHQGASPKVSETYGLRHVQFPQSDEGRGSLPNSQQGQRCLTSHAPAHLPLNKVWNPAPGKVVSVTSVNHGC